MSVNGSFSPEHVPDFENNEARLNELGIQTLSQFGLGNSQEGAPGQAAILSSEQLDVLETVATTDEYHIQVPLFSASCIDERVDENGSRLALAKTAGGPLGIAVALKLSGLPQYANMTEIEIVDHVEQRLIDVGGENTQQLDSDVETVDIHNFAVHGDTHSDCGCGACARAREVDNEISGRFTSVRDVTYALSGLYIDENMQTIAEDIDTGFFVDDEDRASVLNRAIGGGAPKENLVGEHDGQVVIFNYKKGTTLDTTALRNAGIRAFVVDAWAFEKYAELFTADPAEQTEIEKALWAFNIGTGSVLCHEDMNTIAVGQLQ